MIINRINKRAAGYMLGIMIFLLGIMTVIPCIVAYIYSEQALRIFVLTVVLFIITGGTLAFLCRNYDMPLSRRDGQIAVGIIWFIIPILGSLPYMFFADVFSYTDAIFESYSGFTTTGSTIIEDLNKVPRCLLCYRSLTQWIGGLGFAILIMACLKNFHGSLNNFFNAEFFSVTSSKMYPHLRDTVLRILFIYTILTVLCFSSLFISGMDFFSALCHSLSTVSTGGFTTANNGINSFASSTQYVLMLFMFLSGISYFVILNFCRGKFKRVFKDEQLRYYFLLIISVSICFVIYWSLRTDMNWEEKIRSSLFYSVSMVSSTGYDLQLYNIGEFVTACLLLLMFIGGCSASSSTGLKVIRVIILFRYARTSLSKIFHPRAVVPVKYNNKVVEDEDLRKIFGFFFLYLITFIAGIFILCCFGNDFRLSITMSAANLGNIGPAVTGYTEGFSYAWLNTPSQMVLILLMMCGRLEIYSFLALFSKSLYKRI